MQMANRFPARAPAFIQEPLDLVPHLADAVPFGPVNFGSSHIPIVQQQDADALEFTPSPAAVPHSKPSAFSNRASFRDDFDLGERPDDLEVRGG
jgi:hypothetical protein